MCKEYQQELSIKDGSKAKLFFEIVFQCQAVFIAKTLKFQSATLTMKIKDIDDWDGI